MTISGLKTWSDGDLLSTANMNTDKTVLQAKFDGGITTSDLSSSAGIENGQLENDDFELVLSKSLQGSVTASEGLDLIVGAEIAVGGIPYDSDGGAASYDIMGIEHMTFGVSAAAKTAAVMTLKYGNHTDGFTTIQAGITTGTADGQVRETGFTSTVAASATRPNFFVLEVTTAGVAWEAADSWAISIKLLRTNGLRG